MKDNKINLVLIDDHQLLTQSLSSLLSSYEFINSIRCFSSAADYLTEESAVVPDIILSDVLMPGISGLDLLLELKKRGSPEKVIMLSSITEVQAIRQAIKNGAWGYLSKDSSSGELADAILSVFGGSQYIGETLRKKIIRNTFAEERILYTLSAREKEVLNFVCSGKTIKETAFEMKLSINTVQTYYKNILRKLNLNRTVDLIVFAIQNGLYNPNENKQTSQNSSTSGRPKK